MANSNGGSKKHGPGYICYKNAKGKKSEKVRQTKRIAEGKKAAQQRALQR